MANGNLSLEFELVCFPYSCLPATGKLKSIIVYASDIEIEHMKRRFNVGISNDAYGSMEDNYQILHVIDVNLHDSGIAVTNKLRVGQLMRFFIPEEYMAQETLH